MTALSAAVALFLLTFAIVRRHGHYDLASLILVVVSLTVSVAGVCARRSAERETRAGRALPWVLALLVATNFVGLFIRPPARYLAPETSLGAFRVGAAMAAVLAASYAIPAVPRWLSRTRLPVMFAIYLALGAWTIDASPQPLIDVWHFQQRAAQLLFDGHNPWAADYPNVYGHTDYTGSVLLSDGRIRSFPYPPLSLLLSAAGAMAGDVRWALLAATAATAAFIHAAGRPGARNHVVELAPIALLFHARSFFMLEQSWTEPFLALAAAACAWSLTTRRSAALTVSIAALLSVKQYAVLLVPALWRHGQASGRVLATGAGVAAMIALPFALWDFRALWDGVVVYQWAQPFRADALSVPAFWALTFGSTPWQGWGFVAAILAAAGCALFAPRETRGSPATMALAAAATYLAFFVFAKQAFFNYYWFVSVLLVVAVRLPDRSPVLRPPPDGAGP
jgi:hypothetical protein